MDRRGARSTEQADSLSFLTGKVLAAKSTLPSTGEFLKVTGTDNDGQLLLGGSTISTSDITGLDGVLSGIDADIATAVTELEAEMAASLSDAVIIAPTSGTRNTIIPTGNFAALVLQPPGGVYTDNLLEVRDSTGASTLLQINETGSISLGIPGGSSAIFALSDSTNVNVSTIEATNAGVGPGIHGDSDSGPGGLFTTGGATASSAALVARQTGANTANLQEWQDSGGTALSSIDYLGRFNGSLASPPLPTFNTETLAGTRTLTIGTDANIQYLDPGAANRVVELAKSGAAGNVFYIVNTRAIGSDTGQYLSIKNGVAGTEFDRVYATSLSKAYIYDGTNWKAFGVGSGDSDTNRQSVALGAFANARSTDAVAVGNNAYASAQHGVSIGRGTHTGNSGVAVGYGAKGGTDGQYTSGTAVGFSASAAVGNSTAIGKGASATAIGAQAFGVGSLSSGTQGLAVGYAASTNGKAYASAVGAFSVAERYGEHVESLELATTQKYSRSWVGFYGVTTDATATELFIRGTASNRLTVIASSAFMFTAEVIAYCNGATKGKTWTLQGGIRRDGSNNTALIGTVVKTVISEDGTTGYDVTIDANDTNEALRVTVTGAASETVRWTVDIKLTEARF